MHEVAPVRVASYNVRKCVGLDRRRSPGRTLEVISEVAADVVALQEADRRLGPRPTAIPIDEIAKSTDLVPVDLAVNEVSLGWHGNAILVRREMEVVATERLDLPGLEPRGAVLVDISHNQQTFRIIGTHLGLLRPHRQQQMRAIMAALEGRTPMPTIILGDFNEWSANKGMEPLKSHFDVHAPGRSFHAARPVAALDRIATSREITLHDAGVHERGAALKASDHLPVWADIAFS